MSKPKLSTTQFMLIGIILGMLIVFGAFMMVKSKIMPEPVPKMTETSGAQKPPAEQEHCPVCNKPVSSASIYHETIYGKRFNFCREICYRSFKDEPLLYLKNMNIKVDIKLLEPQGEEATEQETDSQTNEPESSQNEQHSTEPSDDAAQDTDSIPMPEEIPLDSGNKTQPSGIEEIPLNSKSSPASGNVNNNAPAIEEIPLSGTGASAPKSTAPAKNNNQSSGIEEIPLNNQPSAKSKPVKTAPAKKTNQSPGIEEIPLNTKKSTAPASKKSQDLQIEEIPLN